MGDRHSVAQLASDRVAAYHSDLQIPAFFPGLIAVHPPRAMRPC